MARDGGARSSRRAASRRTTPGTTGRVTPKGTGAKGTDVKGDQARGRSTTGQSAPASSRYTPPVRREAKVSPRWVPVLMFALLGVGVAVIILNYLGVLPGGSDNLYLLLGLAAITGGFITATQYR